MKSYQIHFIRHGQTEGNAQGRYIGSTDMPLSEEGVRRLQDLREHYDYPGAAVYYSSPLKRCIETCRILYPQATPIAVAGLQECDFGRWEGKTAVELQGDPNFHTWLESGQQTSPPDGESGVEFTRRVCETFEKLVEGLMRTGTTQAVVVAHGGTIMTLLTAYGLPRAKFYDWIVDNGCGYSLRITPGLWMRDKVAEVYAKLPGGYDGELNGDFKYMIDVAREAADRAYGQEDE
jgi:alpha-ribazole phosphatase